MLDCHSLGKKHLFGAPANTSLSSYKLATFFPSFSSFPIAFTEKDFGTAQFAV